MGNEGDYSPNFAAGRRRGFRMVVSPEKMMRNEVMVSLVTDRRVLGCLASWLSSGPELLEKKGEEKAL
ncbi:hypothetical protein H5410_061812 [Solanum commersonii]|uniref:Uncharacterized protein n=1 Tax=Solanum commersonii TaxID=4109 RepID=A0A9J5WAR3_SOLCO|nr:hypothetical protein H5410_061812 [Solanum commersonii]